MSLKYEESSLARRARLFGIFESNEHWGATYLYYKSVSDVVTRCNIGHALHVLGVEDSQLGNDLNRQSILELADRFNLKPRTIARCMFINDTSRDWDVNKRALKAYLLHKNLKRAAQIICSYDLEETYNRLKEITASDY